CFESTGRKPAIRRRILGAAQHCARRARRCGVKMSGLRAEHSTGERAMKRPAIPTPAARLAAALLAIALLAWLGAGSSAAVAPAYHTNYRPGKIVAVGSSIPHSPAVMVDRRIVSNLRYLAQ